jgi:hypothetical protein
MKEEYAHRNTYALSIAVIICALFFTSLLCGCSRTRSPSDDILKAQISDVLQQDREGMFGGTVKFGDFFEIVEIIIDDKLLEEKSLNVVCTAKFKVKEKNEWPEASRNLDTLPLSATPFRVIVGKIEGKKPGEVLTNNFEFMFKEYENGWRIVEELP